MVEWDCLMCWNKQQKTTNIVVKTMTVMHTDSRVGLSIHAIDNNYSLGLHDGYIQISILVFHNNCRTNLAENEQKQANYCH